ncbi:MAG: [FeFe] hydrogenase, group A [Bacilli bacterium]
MKYKCKICSYQTEENINSSYICPHCGSSYQDFQIIDEVDKRIPIAISNPSVERIMEKCINCGRCKTVCEEIVGIHYDYSKALEPVCVNCGQCILNCPTGALVTKSSYKKVLDYIHDTSKIVVVSTAPAVRVSLGEAFNLESGSFVEGKMVSALKKIGFDYVFDITFGADLTIIEEASELVSRLEKKELLPQFTSCCPSWVKYVSIYHPLLLKHLSTCKSPIGMQSAMIKNYLADYLEVDKSDIINVVIAPCTSKKMEIVSTESSLDTDFLLTTNELSQMIKEMLIDFNSLEDEKFDKLLGLGSGAGLIFGSSGGVMEAVLRTTYHYLTNEQTPKEFLTFNDLHGSKEVKTASITIKDKTLNVAVIEGLANTESFIKEVLDKKSPYQFIEVMNCMGGCSGGGGQILGNISKNKENSEIRASQLYEEDLKKDLRLSYLNKEIIEAYKSYLIKPLSTISKELLHTVHTDKSSILGETLNINIEK